MSEQSSNKQNPVVIFLHLPKVGGSTLGTLLDWQYGHGNVCTVSLHRKIPEFKALPVEERARLKCLSGQFGFGIHKWIPGESTYITLLRHPVKRLISSYYYINVRKTRMGLPESGRTIEHALLDDLQTRYQLSFIVGGDDVQQIIESPLPPNALEIAKQNIENHFSVVGLTERFDESLLLMKRALGWKRVWFYARKNVNRARASMDEIPSQTLKLIEQKCEAELELYEYAQKQFDEVVAAQDGSFHDELKRLRRNNRIYGRVWTMARPFRETAIWRSVRKSIGR